MGANIPLELKTFSFFCGNEGWGDSIDFKHLEHYLTKLRYSGTARCNRTPFAKVYESEEEKEIGEIIRKAKQGLGQTAIVLESL